MCNLFECTSTKDTIMTKFNPTKLDERYSNLIKVIDRGWYLYTVQDKYGNDQGTISYLGENEWRYEVDNFPMAKKEFHSNLPINSNEQFELDIERTGLKLISKG